MTGKIQNDDDQGATDEAADDDNDDTDEVIGQPHPRYQEPLARSPLLSASFQIFQPVTTGVSTWPLSC